MKFFNFNQKKAAQELEKGLEKSTVLLKNQDKLEAFLEELEEKMKSVPLVGKYLSVLPVLASMVRAYLTKEYDKAPVGAIAAIVSALVYFVSPIDVILDGIPFLGFLDDAAVIGACLKLVQSDIDDYKAWRAQNQNHVIEGEIIEG